MEYYHAEFCMSSYMSVEGILTVNGGSE